MFTVCIGESIGFSPEISQERSVRNNDSQTEILYNDDKPGQAPERRNAQIQTDTVEKKSNIFVEFDMDSLSDFLKKVTPFVCSVLEKNSKSQAFDRYNILSDLDNITFSCLHVLDQSFHDKFSCPSISWNSIGSAIAAAYCNHTHESWCDHDGSVGIWSLGRRNIDPKKPNIILETDCCITCIAFHPELPAILIAGKFNGEILLWNTAKEDDPLLGSSEATFGNHREPITGLHWLPNNNAHNVEFVSCSLDGKILMWKLEDNILVPYDGFIILTEQLPRAYFVKAKKKNAEVGIISMSINHEDQSIFIFGIEGGGIFQGSFNSLAPASYSGFTSVPLKNPITMNFERHKGQITALQFSKFSRNIFLSAGSDGEIRIYSLLQPKPLKILQLPNGSINSAEWSPIRPLVLSCICSNGLLHIWDLVINESSPNESFPLDSDRTEGLCLQYNKENHNLMATSTANGRIQVWQLPGTVLKAVDDEKMQLQNLSKNID